MTNSTKETLLESEVLPRPKLFGAAFWGVALLCIHAWSFTPFLSDDALISLRYARNLLDGKGLVWNAGEYVEGYSNLLWVLASAALGWVGMDLVVSVRVLGVLGMSAVLCALVYGLRRAASSATLFLGVTVLALSAPLAVWAVGGLEQGFVAGLLAWSLALLGERIEEEVISWRSLLLPSLLLGALTITRPDGALLAALVGAGFFAARLIRSGRLVWSFSDVRYAVSLGIAPFLAASSQLIFRLAYYGDWVPNTAHIKIGPSLNRFQGGLDYILSAISSAAPAFVFVFMCVFTLLSLRRWRSIGVFLTIPALVWTLYVIFIGGDIFPGFRHAVVLFVLAGFSCAWGARALFAQFPGHKLRLYAVVFACLCLFPWNTWMQHREHHNARAKTERWEWNGEVIGTLLRDMFQAREVLLAIDPAGAVPYWSQLPSLDMLGLNDRTIAQNPPENLGSGALAHEFGDGAYVLSRRPDLVLFCLPRGGPGACFRSGREMLDTAEFHENYTLVSFFGQKPHAFTSKIWVRHTSAKIGVKEGNGGVYEIPPWLWSGAGAVSLDGRDAMYRLDGQKVARFGGLSLDQGVWSVEVLATQGDPQLNVRKTRKIKKSRQRRGHAILLEERSPDGHALIRVKRAGHISLELRNLEGDETGSFTRVIVRRLKRP